MKNYLNLLEDILIHGEERDDRTGVGTIGVFGRQLKFDLRDGFPACTSKKLFFKSVVSELLWMLEGSSNEHRLAEIKNDNKPYSELTEKERQTIWTANYENQGKKLGYSDGELGPVYGHQWRFWATERYDVTQGAPRRIVVDQIAEAVDKIKNNPTDRRILVNAWNVAELNNMALPPCHYSFQYYVSGKNKEYLSLLWNQRSVDTACGLPFDIASFALNLTIMAKLTGKIPLEIIGNFGDTHIYKNHIETVREQLQRNTHKLCSLKIADTVDFSSLENFLKTAKTSDFSLENYVCEPPLSYPMAV